MAHVEEYRIIEHRNMALMVICTNKQKHIYTYKYIYIYIHTTNGQVADGQQVYDSVWIGMRIVYEIFTKEVKAKRA